MKYEDLKVGQKVMVVRPLADYSDGWDNTWVGEMFLYINNGKTYTIHSFDKEGIYFDEDDSFQFPWQSLELAKEINTITTQVSVFRKNLNPIYGEGVTHIRIEDEAAGPFIVLSQDDQVIADAALKLLNDSKFYFKED